MSERIIFYDIFYCYKKCMWHNYITAICWAKKIMGEQSDITGQ